MKKCSYCGRENDDAAARCFECATLFPCDNRSAINGSYELTEVQNRIIRGSASSMRAAPSIMTNRKRWIVSLTVGIAFEGVLVGLFWLTSGRNGPDTSLSVSFASMAFWSFGILKPFANYLTVSVGSPIPTYFIIFAFPALVYSLISYVILRPKRKSGSTIWEIVIGVAIMVMVALTVASRLGIATASKNSCVAVLKQLDAAKAQWAVETKQLPTAVPADSDIFGPTLYLRAWPLCEQGGHYTLNAVSVPPTCSKSGAPDFHTL